MTPVDAVTYLAARNRPLTARAIVWNCAQGRIVAQRGARRGPAGGADWQITAAALDTFIAAYPARRATPPAPAPDAAPTEAVQP